jgi:fermentation-respiration switch protein FrsA (DUF1100 family)
MLIRVKLRTATALAFLGLAGPTICLAHLASEPGVFEVHQEKVKLPHRELNLTYVKPVAPKPPGFLILFATGDAGWLGASNSVFERMAERGYYAVAYNSREALKPAKKSGKKVTMSEVEEDLRTVIEQAKHELALPEETPTILSGVSRGASMAVLGAGEKKLQPLLAGAIAVALTRESDYLVAPENAATMPGIKLDEKGGVLTYPAIERLGSLPIAVIQAEGDKYVPAPEARELFGPDTPTRRLYAVKASNHGFRGGQDELLRDVDDALSWIASLPPPESKTPE